MNLLGQFKMMFANHSTTVSKYFNEVAVVFTTLMTFLSYAVGGWDTAIKALVALVVIDIVTGVYIGVFISKSFSSKRLREGFGTKVMYIIVIVVCNIVDKVFFYEAPILRTMACWFYVATEASSILENLANMGVPIPKFVTDRLEQIKEKTNNGEKDFKE